MESQGTPDTKVQENHDNENVGWRTNVSVWALIATICIAVATGSWAISAEVHNYRLQNITTRLGTQEVRFLAFMEKQAILDASQDLQISHNETVIEEIRDDISEIKADVKTLLGDHR